MIYEHFFPSITKLKCTTLDRQLYPSLGTPGLSDVNRQ